ncbi:doublecortin domain-containing protein 2 [Tachysurus fulvidraco]|uniref:doublecortin domain-containing protein 2 n=1 Tax=Tachysurus fulvidraco TaxID=1234273 RepID=UPI001FEF818D|nr:doublecortin domain-containing protein 2 [Tachysurus fulvidraco]
MSCEKPSFRAQPAVRSIFVYKNGDAHMEARRVLIHEKRVCDFETLLREVTGRVRAPFGAVRSIYTPRAGHRVETLEHVRHGEQYVAAGKEKFKKLDYLQIRSKKKQMLQNNGLVKAAPPNRIIVSARFLKPIKEPCAIFIVANGDILNPAVRFLVPSRLFNQYDRILEMITEKMGLRILGGVRSLCSLEGVPLTDGKDLENGQFYVAVGRDKFKRLPYANTLFTKPVGMRRNIRSKAASLPPIDKYARHNGEVVNGVSNSNHIDDVKITDPAISLMRQISQARLMAIRKKRSNLTNSFSTQDNDEAEAKPECKEVESKEEPEEDENSAAEQVYGSEDVGAGEEEAAAGEEEAAAGEEEAAAEQEEAAAEEEAEAEQEEAAAEQEEAVDAEEEAAAEEAEAAADEAEAAAVEEEAAAGEEEEVAEEEEAAAGEEEAAAGEEEAAAGEEEAAAEEEEAAAEEAEVAVEQEEAAEAKEESEVEAEAVSEAAGEDKA